MLFKEIEKNCQSAEGLQVIETSIDSMATDLETINSNLKDTTQVDGESINTLLIQATGIWGHLKVVCEAIDTYKTNKELAFYHTQKVKIESANEKFNVSATEKEARALTNDERRIRNLVEAYMASADKIILSCQSVLKYLSDSIYRNKTQA